MQQDFQVASALAHVASRSALNSSARAGALGNLRAHLVLIWFNPTVDDEPIQLPIDGVLDLHTFKPKEVKDLVLDYLAECQARGILRVRIIHGKGIGQLRQTVHALLAKHPDVASFNLASEHFGGWGATIVHLKKREGGESSACRTDSR